MQAIATEMNLSETAFITRSGPVSTTETPSFDLRWFTPASEVPLCGHATLASAAILFDVLRPERRMLAFDTKSGRLTAMMVEDGIRLDFPAYEVVPMKPPMGLLDAMGIHRWQDVGIARDGWCVLVRLEHAAEVVDLEPDFDRMVAETEGMDLMCAIVTARGQPPHDIVSRVFAPWLGVNEDPVTGAAHTVLGPYWSGLLGKERLRAFQASRRGGELVVEMAGEGRVYLEGKAVVLMRGELLL